MTATAVTRVANLAEASAALQVSAAPTTELWSPENGAEIQGVLWFVMLQRAIRDAFPDRHVDIVLDCGKRGDLAIEAMRLGLKAISLNAGAGVTEKVADIAAGLGARLYA